MKGIAAIIFVIFWSSVGFGQHIRHGLHTRVDGSRNSVYHNVGYSLELGKLTVLAGTGYRVLPLVQSAHYAPHVYAGCYFTWLEKEKNSVQSGLFYQFGWNTYAQNPHVRQHGIYAGYRFQHGVKWQVIHELGMGASARLSGLEKTLWMADARLSIGIAYVF
jgi:hypothetical protein